MRSRFIWELYITYIHQIYEISCLKEIKVCMGTMWYYRPILKFYIGFVLMTIKRIYPILSNFLKTSTFTFRTRFTWTYNQQDGRTDGQVLDSESLWGTTCLRAKQLNTFLWGYVVIDLRFQNFFSVINF